MAPGHPDLAFWYTVTFIFFAGCFLDFILGGLILNFADSWNQEIFGDEYQLVRISWKAIVLALAMIAGGILLKVHFNNGAWPPPYYFTFLVIAALAPAVVFYRSLENVVNWRALGHSRVRPR